MSEITLQIGCLAIVLYMTIVYIRDTYDRDVPCNKYFDALLTIAPWAIFLDGATAFTVNRLDRVSLAVNRILHLGFFVSMVAIVIVTSLYMYDKLIGFNKDKVRVFLMCFPGIVSILLIISNIGKLQFIQGVNTNYSLGFSVYVCFVTVALYYGYIILMIIIHHRFIPKGKKSGTASFILLVGILLVVQLVFPEMLLTAACTTIMILGIYIVYENPSLTKVEMQKEKMVDSFATLVESRDLNTGGHIKRTRLYVQLILRNMKRSPKYYEVMSRDYISYVLQAAPLHDIGKISTPDEILQKPGKLTDEEYDIMKEHAACGGDIILNTFRDMYSAEAKRIACEVARYHHEKYNGKGYPEGLAGEDIPLHARIMAIADVFDAVSQKRCYRDAMPLEDCFAIIERGSGTDFDPELVKIFLDAKEEVSVLWRNNT